MFFNEILSNDIYNHLWDDQYIKSLEKWSEIILKNDLSELKVMHSYSIYEFLKKEVIKSNELEKEIQNNLLKLNTGNIEE